jgi:sec-independent protein translocase protein TatA
MELLSPWHLAIVLLIALIVLGPKRLPEVGRALGSSIRGFRSSLQGDDDLSERPLPAPDDERRERERPVR